MTVLEGAVPNSCPERRQRQYASQLVRSWREKAACSHASDVRHRVPGWAAPSWRSSPRAIARDERWLNPEIRKCDMSARVGAGYPWRPRPPLTIEPNRRPRLRQLKNGGVGSAAQCVRPAICRRRRLVWAWWSLCEACFGFPEARAASPEDVVAQK